MPTYQTKTKNTQVYQDSVIHQLTEQKPSTTIRQKVSKGPGHNIAHLQLKPKNTDLPDHLKNGMEHLSGMSLDHVKVHYNSSKPAIFQAHAYAQGSEIHLGAGQEKHLPHELAHVVQQAQGRVKPTNTVGGMAINDNAELEKEADVMGAQALQMQPKENKSRVKSGFGVADNRPEAIQLKAIKGEIEKLHGSWQTRGVSVTPATINNTRVRVSPVDNTSKNLLDPNNGFIWGHLIKAAWDGGNDTGRLTLWNNARENAWTNIEQNAQRAVNNINVPDGTYEVNVNTTDKPWGTTILGGSGKSPSYNPKWLQTAEKIDVNRAPIANVRNALNTVVTAVEMKVHDGGKHIYTSGKVNMGKPSDLTKLKKQ
ncbi:DUF4157 domain-containing protein [uncultured Shewanella sp.]|uniref:eCIS core domain-containing protein n=1 Tax=uncultured Shewanella sp. TaxID=173975 RepID=UPI002607A9EF|nr:DUF4157 domain-containing protein [uncultured Shewanella sp.]